MKTTDVNALKGVVKKAVLSWGNSKIDELFAGREKAGFFAKKALGNYIAREDEKINSWIDNAFLFIADERGNVDSDEVVDTLCEMLGEMKESSYPIGPVTLAVGNGEIGIKLPNSFLLDMFMGNRSVIKFTKEDFLELKNYF